MIKGFAALLLFQLLGESIVFVTGLAVPGPVVGLLLLFIAMRASLRFGWSPWAPVESASTALLSNLGLLFVPAGVGVVTLGRFVEGQTFAIVVVLVVSAVMTLGATMLAFVGVRRLIRREGAE